MIKQPVENKHSLNNRSLEESAMTRSHTHTRSPDNEFSSKSWWLAHHSKFLVPVVSKKRN